MKQKLATVLAVAILSPFVIIGCKSDSGLNPDQQQMATRLDEIVKKSGGEWNKLSDADRTYLIKDISYGSEPSARMLFMAKAGKLKANPVGPGGPSSK